MILIINNWRSNKNVFFLAFLFIILSIYGLGHYVVIYCKSVFWTVIFYNNFMPLMLLLGPFLFFYIRGVLTPKTNLKGTDFLHFIPFAINLAAIIPYYFTSYSYKVYLAQKIIANVNLLLIFKVNALLSPSVNFILRPVCFIVYILFSFIFIWKSLKKKSKKTNVSFNYLLIKYQWFFGLLVMLLLLIGCYFIISFKFVRTTSYNETLSYKWYFIIAEIAFIIISFSLLFFPKILYGYSNEMVNIKPKKSNRNPIEESSFFIIQNEFKTDLNENDPLYELANIIRLHYVKERPYLKHKYSISDLAMELKTQENHLVYCFKSVFKVSFTKLKNHLRIEYAKELLKGEIHDSFTIDAIAHKSGFSTRSNFYNTFNKIVGCSPTDYLKSIES